MEDTILTARIDALERSLKAQDRPDGWPKKFTKDLRLEQTIWRAQAHEIHKTRTSQTKRLAKVREALKAAKSEPALAEVWREYSEVYESSQSMLHESFEVLGGLAFRDRLLDDELCRIAEVLLTTYTLAAKTIPPLAVPARESVSRTMAKIVRVRCPEWTIWTLPLAAHEYGRVVIDDFDDLCEFVDENREPVAAQAAGGLPGDPAERAHALGDAQKRLEVLFGDAFATFTVGPAYGFAALDVVLQPGAVRRPDHRLRGEMILAMLRDMVPAGGAGFAVQVQRLEEDWVTLLTRVGRERLEPPAEVLALVGLVKEHEDLGPAGYRHRIEEEWPFPGVNGWSVATEWAVAWLHQLSARETPAVPRVTGASQIRDVLNAAWLARSAEPSAERVPLLERAARDTCAAVIAARQLSANGGDAEQSHGSAPR